MLCTHIQKYIKKTIRLVCIDVYVCVLSAFFGGPFLGCWPWYYNGHSILWIKCCHQRYLPYSWLIRTSWLYCPTYNSIREPNLKILSNLSVPGNCCADQLPEEWRISAIYEHWRNILLGGILNQGALFWVLALKFWNLSEDGLFNFI